MIRRSRAFVPGLFRCVLCRAFTKASPLLLLGSGRLHRSVCLDCAGTDLAFEAWVTAWWRDPWGTLHALLSGRVA